MLFRTTIIATAAIALLSAVTDKAEAHSWADCVDWRFKDPKKPGWRSSDGTCFAHARKYPVNSAPFGDLDSSDPNRHYQQDPSDFTACSDGKHGREPGADETRQNPISKAYGGRFGKMATVKAGDMMCVRWPAKNHAVKDEEDRGVFINMPKTIMNRDPTQSEFMKETIAKLPYKNCNHNPSDTDHTPCGGCFIVPADRQPGIYSVQWRWELNDNEWYTSCWDLQVTAGDPNAPPSKGIQFGTLPGTEIGDVNGGIDENPQDGESGDGDSGDGGNGDSGDGEDGDSGDGEDDDSGDGEDDEDDDSGDGEDDEGDDEEDDGEDDEEDDGEDDEDSNDDDDEESGDGDNDDEDDGEDDEEDDDDEDDEDDGEESEFEEVPEDEDENDDEDEDDNNDDDGDEESDDFDGGFESESKGRGHKYGRRGKKDDN